MKIYTVTVMKIGTAEQLNELFERRGFYGRKIGANDCFVLRKRTWGWFPTFEDAYRTVFGNYCDIYELGYYPHAVIEEMGPGISPHVEREWWFEWRDEVDDGYDPGYFIIEKPEGFKNSVNFAIG